ncbi:lectin OAA family protein [Pleionea sediminis]|uniref:lectin OAA family protein n=1 Tax=Pleionea sediminis TaxID=2569479 RepID=UPI00197C87A5|nr:hypothetical protein [Pleionea sediminis]
MSGYHLTLQLTNNFNELVPNGTDYFNQHYSDNQVWLFFLNTSGKITYTDTKSGDVKTVADSKSIALSDIKGHKLTLDKGEESTKLFVGLGNTCPFSNANGPGLFDQATPYGVIEWTIKGNSYDNVDVSYIDQFSFPTSLIVKDSQNKVKLSSSFIQGTKAQQLIDAFKLKISGEPVGPAGAEYPTKGNVGYGPAVDTISDNSQAVRWVGSSKYWVSGPDKEKLRSLYIYAPSFSNYLSFLQDKEPQNTIKIYNKESTIKGWYLDYSGNNGYSGYLSITGDANKGFGLEVHNIRVNTCPSAANNWAMDPASGTATTGKITILANGSTIPFDASSNVKGDWTDAVIYSGAAVQGEIGAGPVVIGTDDFKLDPKNSANNGTYVDIVATFLATISAAMATGLLGSQLFLDKYNDASDKKSTMYWFNTMTRADSLSKLFDKAWPNKTYYDPYWATLSAFTDNQGYLSPFNDRWSFFSPDLNLANNDVIEWQLGIPLTNYQYKVENQWGGDKAPWHDGGQWVMGCRKDQLMTMLKVSSSDNGQTLEGTVTYVGEGPIAFKAERLEQNIYKTFTQWGGDNAPWHPAGTWFMGCRDDQNVVAINIQSDSEGTTLSGSMTYDNEGEIGFKATRVKVEL